MKKGLVLEGGGMRGMFTAGVTDQMMEEGLSFDGIIGVSAGALFGCNYKSHQPGRALRYNIRFKDDPRYMGIRSLLRTGNLVNADFAYHVMPTQLDVFDGEAFASDPTEFWLVATDIERGTPIYRQMTKVDYECLEWMRASGSMPIVSRPVEIDGMKLLDGGMTDSIPLAFAQSKGFERNIVVLTQPLGFRKTKTRLTPLFRMSLRRYPKVAEVMARRHDMYNAQLDYISQQAKAGNIYLICPNDTLGIGRMEQNEEKMRAIHAQGKETAKRLMDDIRAFLAD